MEDYRKLFDLAGKKALVFGAASGIGKASAEAIASMGAEVHCADIDEAKAQETAAGIRQAGGKASASRADASKGEDIIAMVARAKSELALRFRRREEHAVLRHAQPVEGDERLA